MKTLILSTVSFCIGIGIYQLWVWVTSHHQFEDEQVCSLCGVNHKRKKKLMGL